MLTETQDIFTNTRLAGPHNTRSYLIQRRLTREESYGTLQTLEVSTVVP